MQQSLTPGELQQLSHDDYEALATLVRKEGKRRVDSILKALGHSQAPKGRGRPSSTTPILDSDDSDDSDDTSDDA